MSTVSVEPALGAASSAPAGRRPQVVLCDDETTIRKLYRRALRTFEVDLVDAADGEQCLEQVALLHPDLVVLDLTLPGRNGFEVLPEILALSPHTQVVVVSGLVTTSVVHEAHGLGASACVEKVQFIPQLRAIVRELAR